MTGLVTREDSDGVALLTLNRPDVLNALSPKLFEELRAHVDRLAGETESIGCVVLRAAGRSFSAGNDLNAIRAGERALRRNAERRFAIAFPAFRRFLHGNNLRRVTAILIGFSQRLRP